MSHDADAIVSAIIAKWCAGFATLDAVALSSLYSKNAFFLGSNPIISTAFRAGASRVRPFRR